MTTSAQVTARRFGWTWVFFAFALALHVLDEAAHDFLSFYNPNVLAIRARLPWLPLPTFTFWEFLIELFAVVALLLSLSPQAFRGRRWLRKAAVPLGVVIGILNGTQHIVTSIVLHRLMPGVYSSPLEIVAGVLLLRSARVQKISPYLD